VTPVLWIPKPEATAGQFFVTD